MAEVRGPYLTAKMPAGIWNRPTPIKKAAVIEPSRETSLLNSNAINGNMAGYVKPIYTIDNSCNN